jgi:probable rRNA maturation factor
MTQRTATEAAAGARVLLTVQDASGAAGVPVRRTLLRWARAAVQQPAEVTIRVVGTREGRRLNKAWRDQDHATNVMSFEYGRVQGMLRGDVVLCAPVVAREAREQGKRLVAHYAHMVVHGLLHLQGHDHQTGAEAQRMEALERRILAHLGHADPYRSEGQT